MCARAELHMIMILPATLDGVLHDALTVNFLGATRSL
jgi:hypothetical protein